MANLKELNSDLDFGDISIIAKIYNDIHRLKGCDGVSSSYVGKILRGDRQVAPGTKAEEVMKVAQSYLRDKRRIKDRLIAA